MAIRDIYKARSTDMLDLSCCAAADFCALLATLRVARACAFAASNSWTSSTKCVFSRMNIMRSILLASMLLRRSPMRWTSAEKCARPDSCSGCEWSCQMFPYLSCPLMEST